MSKGSGCKNAPLRWLAVFVIASALCAGAASAQGVALQERGAAKQSDQETEQAEPQTRATAPENETQRTGYQADCSNPEDHAAADWCQQERAAAGAQRAAAAAEAAIEISRNQSLLLWLTLAITGAALVAAFRAANAAHKTLEGLERPYLLVYAHNILRVERARRRGDKQFETTVLTFRFGVNNYGRAPCIIRSVNVFASQSEKLPETVQQMEFLELTWPNIILAEGKHHDFEASAEIDPALSNSRYQTGLDRLFVRGTFVYESVTGAWYERRFCYWRQHGDNESAEYGGSEYNGERRIRRRSKFERWLRSEVWLRVKHGFRHPAGPLPKKKKRAE